MWQIIRHWIIPHHTNNHRPKALHIDILFVYLLFFLIFNFVLKFAHNEAPQVLGYATDIYADQLLATTNEKRQASGMELLVINTQLSQAAALKAQNMFANNYWAHYGPDGKSPWDFINQSGYRYTVAGENLAKNFGSSQAVVDAWMASPSHRENILKADYKYVGFAVVNGKINGEETTLVVQMFGTQSNQAQLAAVKPVVLPQAAKTDTIPPPAETVTPTPLVLSPAAAIGQITPVPQRTEPAEINTNSPVQAVLSNFVPVYSGVRFAPLINIPTMTRVIAYGFIGILMFIFILDAWFIARRRIVRVTGHSLAHLLFLGGVLLLLTMASSGSII